MWSLVPDWKARLHQRRRWLFAVGLACALCMFVLATKLTDSLVYRTIGLLPFNMFIGMTVRSLTVLRWPRSLPVVLAAGLSFLSDLAYPFYLVHELSY